MLELSVFDAILKEDYLGPIRSHINIANPLLKRLDSNSKDISGRKAIIPMEFGFNQGVGARKEKAILPSAGEGEYKVAEQKLKSYYGSMEMTGQTMRQSEKGDKGSFGRAIDIETKGLKNSLSLMLGHDFYMGHELGECTDQTVDIAETGITMEDKTNMEYFYKGMVVDFVVRSSGAYAETSAKSKERKIASVNKSAGLIKFVTNGDDSLDLDVGDILVRTNTYGACVQGLNDIIDSAGTLQGIDPVSFPSWASIEQDAGSIAFTLANLKKFIDAVSIESGKYPTVLISDFTTQGKYLDLIQVNPRYVMGESKMLDGGFKSLEYSAGASPITWLADRLCPKGTLFAIHEPDLQVYSPSDFDWITDLKTGNIWMSGAVGSSPVDTYSAKLFRDIELGCLSRNSHGKWTGI